MKPLTTLLVTSLVANIAMATWAIHSGRGGLGRTEPNDAPALQSLTGHKNASHSSSLTPDAANVIEQLRTGSPEAIRDLLRKLDFPEETIRIIVNGYIWGNYSERFEAIQPKEDHEKAWWKDRGNWYNLSPEQRIERNRLFREAHLESARILGEDDDNWGFAGTSYDFLPDQKRKAALAIEKDYGDLIDEVQQYGSDFPLASDKEKLRFLNAEKKRDLVALLTPEELADYELRMSPTAQQLRWKMSDFDATEAEYRAIYAVQKAYDDRQDSADSSDSSERSPDAQMKQGEAQKQLDEQIKTLLGAERYVDYLRSQNYEYQQLQSATKRLSLPAETATNVYNLRYNVVDESKRIADNPNLDYAQKLALLSGLVQKTREQISAQLGAEASGIILKSSMNWLDRVANGQIATFNEGGEQIGVISIPKPPKKKPTPKS